MRRHCPRTYRARLHGGLRLGLTHAVAFSGHRCVRRRRASLMFGSDSPLLSLVRLLGDFEGGDIFPGHMHTRCGSVASVFASAFLSWFVPNRSFTTVPYQTKRLRLFAVGSSSWTSVTPPLLTSLRNSRNFLEFWGFETAGTAFNSVSSLVSSLVMKFRGGNYQVITM